jgi:capsular exopolysaccharide synthesis family protein
VLVDLRAYLDFVQRRWLLLLAGPLLAGLGGLLISGLMTPKYQASALVLVKPEVPSDTAPPGDLINFERFSNTYAALMKSPTVLKAASEVLELDLAVEDLEKRIQTTPIEDTELIEVSVVDESPALAADLANAVPAAFVDLNPGQDVTPGVVTLVRSASIPREPISPNLPRNLLLAAVLGLMTAALICFALDNLDERVRSPAATQVATGIPVVAELRRIRFSTAPPMLRLPIPAAQIALDRAVANILRSMGRPIEQIPASKAFLQSPSFEAFRHLRTAIDFSASASELKVITVTSPNAGEGKSTAAANLSIVMAQAGKRVILVDADMRSASWSSDSSARSSHFGISGLLLNDIFDPSPALVATDVDNLQLLPSGATPENAAEILSSQKMLRLMRALRSQADYVIVDTSPALAASEAVWLSANSDVTLLVVAAGRTRISDVRHSAQLMSNVNARVLGIIVNRTGAGHEWTLLKKGSEGSVAVMPRASAANGSRPRRRPKRKQDSAAQEQPGRASFAAPDPDAHIGEAG